MLNLESTFDQIMVSTLEQADTLYQEASERLDKVIKSICILEEDAGLDFGEIYDITDRENHVWHSVKRDYPHLYTPSPHIIEMKNLNDAQRAMEEEKAKLNSLHFKAQGIELKNRLYKEAMDSIEVYKK